ncbi:hypothetical protein HID58_034929 [Brassica napus]|uniref:Uncharacterized protein n=1 Tax=Brassica napus TaxID=3708 RepID=A0ABQ8C3M2_BRANA|nr:hypothetical protein HID58_034929 [Brassica napus]
MSVPSPEHFFLHGLWSSPLRLHSPVNDCLVGALMPRLSIIGSLSFTDATLAFEKRRFSQFLLRRLLVTESGGLQSSALPSWNSMSFGLW